MYVIKCWSALAAVGEWGGLGRNIYGPLSTPAIGEWALMETAALFFILFIQALMALYLFLNSKGTNRPGIMALY